MKIRCFFYYCVIPRLPRHLRWLVMTKLVGYPNPLRSVILNGVAAGNAVEESSAYHFFTTGTIFGLNGRKFLSFLLRTFKDACPYI